MTVRIIVNADDLGIGGAVDEAIFRGMERRAITSATIIANGPTVASATRMLHRFPECSFGVHLNVTEFEPVCPESSKALAKILDGRNRFNGNAIREVSISVAMLKAIYKEWCEQIESLIRLGVQPSHLDAHHHVHTVPQMLPVLAALRRRYRINKIRISRNMYATAAPASRPLLAKKWFYNQALRGIGFRTTRIFTDLETFVGVCGVRPPGESMIEVMTHPGSGPTDEESRLLENDWIRNLPYAAKLVSYKAL